MYRPFKETFPISSSPGTTHDLHLVRQSYYQPQIKSWGTLPSGKPWAQHWISRKSTLAFWTHFLDLVRPSTGKTDDSLDLKLVTSLHIVSPRAHIYRDSHVSHGKTTWAWFTNVAPIGAPGACGTEAGLGNLRTASRERLRGQGKYEAAHGLFCLGTMHGTAVILNTSQHHLRKAVVRTTSSLSCVLSRTKVKIQGLHEWGFHVHWHPKDMTTLSS